MNDKSVVCRRTLLCDLAKILRIYHGCFLRLLAGDSVSGFGSAADSVCNAHFLLQLKLMC